MILSIEHAEVCENPANGWEMILTFTEKDVHRVNLQKYVVFPKIALKEDQRFTENTVHSFGAFKISGFVKHHMLLNKEHEPRVLRKDGNSMTRGRSTGRTVEAINHHIPREDGEVKFVLSTGVWSNPPDKDLQIRINALRDKAGLSPEEEFELQTMTKKMAEIRGPKLPHEEQYSMEYIFRKGEWVPKLYIEFLLRQSKKEKRQEFIAHAVDLHTALKGSKTIPEMYEVFKKFTVPYTPEDEDLKVFKKARYEATKHTKVFKTVELHSANGASTFNYSPVQKSKTPSLWTAKPGTRSWESRINDMRKRGVLSPFQEAMASQLLMLTPGRI